MIKTLIITITILIISLISFFIYIFTSLSKEELFQILPFFTISLIASSFSMYLYSKKNTYK